MIELLDPVCIGCGGTFEWNGSYHGYYCGDCRLERGEQRGQERT
ncbi:hypothetical protein [Halostagnicola sp. A-GB9-2]|nr:hypothetical protein [Halostagnicola sp. A-GB9-2]MDJ1433174.1 hypothetical protein [Halostagnicola sp. A-GB9-2]